MRYITGVPLLQAVFTIISINSFSQLKWQNVDSLFKPLPPSVHVYMTTDPLDGKPNIAYYVEADLKDKNLLFTVDTTWQRRLKPSGFYEKNGKPLLVVNTTFFSFGTHQNLSVVIKEGKLVGYNIHSIPGRGKDTFTYRHPFTGAIGISKKRSADIAWVFTDSSLGYAYASQSPVKLITDSFRALNPAVKDWKHSSALHPKKRDFKKVFHKWKMQTAVGGGPVLVQDNEIRISNNQELKFAGKAIDDKHPRTAMGFTNDDRLIILVVQGRFSGVSEGATLIQEAQILKELGCREALNLDGGGSSCLLVNGRETIKPSDREGQRPIPAAFIIKVK